MIWPCIVPGCTQRRETSWEGRLTLEHFKPTPPPPAALVEDLIKETK